MISQGRLYSPLVWSLAALLGACSVVLSVFMVSSIIGPFEFLDQSRPFTPARSGIWWPESAPESGSDGERRVSMWRAALPSEPAPSLSRDLASLRADGVELVAVADATRLTAGEREALLAFAEDGGGVLVTGAVSVRDRDGSWLGWRAMAELLGVEEIAGVDAEASRGMRCALRGPVSAALPPGCRVPLSRAPGAPGVDELEAELRWQGGSEGRRGASRRLRVGAGRIVWLAAGPEAGLGDTDEEHDPMRKLLHSAAAWATGRPFLEVLPWPEGRRFAIEIPAEIATNSTREAEEAAPASPPVTAPDAASAAVPLSERIAQAQRRGTRIRVSSRELLPVSAGPAPLEALRASGGWIASAEEIDAWSRQRAGILTGLEVAGPRRLLVTVTNRGKRPLEGLALRVHLNRPYNDLDVEGMTVLQAAPHMRVAEEGRVVDLMMPPLAGRSSHAWSLDGLPAQEQPAPVRLATSALSRSAR